MAGSGNAHLRSDALLSARDLVVEYPSSGAGSVQAVSGVSLDVLEGETLGIVGESGCGKSTTARVIAGQLRPNAGEVVYNGEILSTLRGEALRRTRIKLQMIFQDPISSLHPRRPVEDIIEEGLRIWDIGDRSERQMRVKSVMEAVGLAYDPRAKRRRDQFSGGQAQRISLARSLVLDPRVLVCDEPVSALDVSVQAQILNMLADMRRRYSLTMIFIGHDLAVVRHISDRIIVMYMGKVCELAPAGELYRQARHHYSRTLLDAIPHPDPTRRTATAVHARPWPATSSATEPPSGCRFRRRCPAATTLCAEHEPVMRELTPGHFVACHHPLDPNVVPGRGYR